MATIAKEEAINDAKIEQMLSEKLMSGYVLMEATCPKCAVPLVKNHQMVPKSLSIDEHDAPKIAVDDPIVLPSASFEQPFKPVDGVPMCVACDSHVITSEMEIAILEQDESLKDKGSIYVALEAATETIPETPEVEKPIGKEPEVINLENVTEDDVIVGEHRKKFVVDIETVDMDGMSNVEMVVSPQMGDARKPINVEDMPDAISEEEQAERREIATKVLGAKMLQGWTLKEKICASCAMPVMTYKGKESCPVCPALAKRAKKKLKEQQKLEAEKERLAREIQAKKDLIERTEQFPEIMARREEVEFRAAMEDEEATIRAVERKRAIIAEKERLLALAPKQGEEKKNDEETSAEARDRARASLEQEKIELKRLEAIAKEEEERRVIMAKANGKDVELALKETIAKQEAAAKELAEEAEAIEAFDEATIADDKTEAMKKDRLVEEHRKKVANKIVIDDEVARLEEERLAEAMEARRIAEERRIESEARMIAALEADAAVKALAAEEAIRRAKAALQEVSATKQQIISNTIEQAEREALAETEDLLKENFEEHNEPMIVQTDSEIYKDRWETLRLEGRAIMTRRVLKGWSITSQACLGVECYNSPLIEKNGCKECVVCGGTGSGKDGVYEAPEEIENDVDVADEPSQVPASVAKSMATSSENDILGQDWLGNGQEEKFEQMREIYSKEIGKKMLMGWKLVDSSCPKCVMPMMMDDKGNTDICIVKGCKGAAQKHMFDASTIATRDMAETFDDESHRPLSAIPENLRATPSDESDLVSLIQKQAPKQQKKRNPVISSDPPAYKPTTNGVITGKHAPKTIITLPSDFADAAAIRELVGVDQGRDDKDTSVNQVANLFLKSPHGYDFQDFGKSMSVDEVKELVEIFLVTNLDKSVSDPFKMEVAKCILSKTNTREASSPLRLRVTTSDPFDGGLGSGAFVFGDHDYVAPSKAKQRVRPTPEHGASPKKLPPLSPGYRNQLSPTYSQQMRSPRSPRDDVSVLSRASTVASDALESIYDRIDQCKKKLLDPNNSLDEQIATASLLEKLAQAAVAVKEMEVLE